MWGLAVLKAVPWRLVAAVALVAAFAVAGWRVTEWRAAYKALPGLKAALAREEACQDGGSRCYERQRALQEATEHASAKTVATYEAEIEALRARPAVRRVIRLCPDAGTGDLRRTGTPAGTDGTGTPAGVVHGPAEFDPQPLFDLARDADEVAARLRALQAYGRSVSTPSQ